MRKKYFSRKMGRPGLYVAGLVFAGALLSPLNGFAQIAPTPCDTTYFDSMRQRAWLEAEREIIQNQNLIFKPDSVLAYTCFDRYLYELADHAEQMFSETTRWGTDVLTSPQNMHMNRALETLVASSLNVYLNSNFPTSATLLGGRGSTTRNTVASSIPNGSYECNIMQAVWMEAKCYDFQGAEDDGFFTFEEYAANPNRRPFPTPCTSGSGPMALGGLFTSAMNTAGLNPDSPPPWPIDTTATYLDVFDAANCGGGDEYPPIATGIHVRRDHQTPQQYFEGVCLQPGCHYEPVAGGPTGTPTAGGSCVP